LPAHVGSGKSIFLSDLANKINYEDNILLYEASNIKTEKNREDIKNEIVKDQNIILCLDAIDEITEDSLKQKINNDISQL
jgi:ABC-type iron transport system FetAB ATPase subunit